MTEHTEKYILRSIAIRRAKHLIKRFDYVVVIRDRQRNYWIHTSPQELDGDKLILELKG